MALRPTNAAAAPRLGQYLALGCASVLGIGLLSVASVMSYHLWRGNQQTQIIASLEKAVRASFPSFCTQPGEYLMITVVDFPPQLFYTQWEVTCGPVRPGHVGTAMMISTADCTVNAPILLSPEWSQTYGRLFASGQKLAVCP